MSDRFDRKQASSRGRFTGKRKPGGARFSDGRIAWFAVQGLKGSFIGKYRVAPDEEPGPELSISVMNPSNPRANVFMPLTSLTEAELTALRDFFILAFDQALPIVRLRDAAAAESLEQEGNDSWTRLYRGVPTNVVRKGSFGEDGNVLWERLKDASGLDNQGERDGSAGGGVRAGSDEVADGDAGGSVSEDHNP